MNVPRPALTCLFLAPLFAASAAIAAPPPTPSFAHDPASACAGAGGQYLGDLKCKLPNGTIGQILSGAEAHRANESSTLVAPSTRRAWALATTALNFEINGNRHDLLGGTYATPEAIANDKKLLANWWDVENRGQLLQTLKWLQFDGHRSGFRVVGLLVGWMPETLYQFVRRHLSPLLYPQELNRLAIAHQYYASLGSKGILAWDLIRYINLCRWGYMAGYVSEPEAWTYIMPAARRLQLTFTSWQDLQMDFLIGREYWSESQTRKDGPRFRIIYDQFLKDPSSPWNVNPWTLDLQVEPLQVERNWFR